MSDEEANMGGEEEMENELEGEAGESGETEKEQDEELGEEEEKEQGEEEQEEDKVPEKLLTDEIIGECLSLLCKTGDGLAHAYVRLDIHEREITNINILKSFIHLRYVDVSKNNLKDISALSALTHMLTLKADNNLLTCVKIEEMPYLQVASFNFNKINSLSGVNHPMLEHLSLNNNEITSLAGLDGSKLNRLHTLELRSNKLTSTEGLKLANLKNLFLAANTIKSVSGLDALTNLTTFHLRDNQIDNLDGFTENLKSLQYVNMRGNNVGSAKEVTKLQALPLLRALVLSENPAAEEDDYRLEILIALRKLERLDKDEYNEEERNEAEEIYEQRLRDAENEKEGEEGEGD